MKQSLLLKTIIAMLYACAVNAHQGIENTSGSVSPIVPPLDQFPRNEGIVWFCDPEHIPEHVKRSLKNFTEMRDLFYFIYAGNAAGVDSLLKKSPSAQDLLHTLSNVRDTTGSEQLLLPVDYAVKRAAMAQRGQDRDRHLRVIDVLVDHSQDIDFLAKTASIYTNRS